MFSRAELVTAACWAPPATIIVFGYVADAVGLGILPALSVVAGLTVAAVLLAQTRRVSTNGPLAVLGLTTTTVAACLAWSAWPDLLPRGGGPDLTHHLVLADYIHQRLALVHDPDASRQLGEMAYYTPGLHLLTAIVAQLARTDTLFVMYPIVILSRAIKCAVLVLIVARVTPPSHVSSLAVALVAALATVWPLTFDSFMRDSYLSQVAAEMFAVAMLWAVIVWVQQRSTAAMLLFALAGMGAFLTWPLWIGATVLALTLTVVTAADVPVPTRARHYATAVGPILAIAGLYSMSRLGAAAIVGTSGAVAVPSLSTVPWWLLAAAGAGLVVTARAAAARPVVWLTATLAVQSAALWVAARWSGAQTPYLAIKMMYLAIYPVALAAAFAAARLLPVAAALWLIALATSAVAIGRIRERPAAEPIVAADLYDAGVWARTHLPSHCIDYLVRNEYTAYWLHLAVLRNARLTPRSLDDDLYVTERAFARWIEDTGAPYAIARRSVVPADIRTRVRVLYEQGDAMVVARVSSTPVAVDGNCVVSRVEAGS